MNSRSPMVNTIDLLHHFDFDDDGFMKLKSMMNNSSIPLVHTSKSKQNSLIRKLICLSFRKRWYEHLQPRDDHSSSLQPSESGQMTVMGDIFNDNVDSLVRTTDPTLILTQFHHLVVDTKTVSIEELVDVLDNLPNVISLKLHYVTTFQPFDSSEEEEDDDDDDEGDEEKKRLVLVSQTNKITEVYLEQMNDFKELDYLLGLCRHVKHLHINSLPNINIKSFIREFLIRMTGDSNEDFCLLCLRIPTADDQLIEKLEKIIDSDGRLVDYTIKRVMDKIYLQRE